MKTREIKDIILKELPAIIEEDKEVKDFIINLFKDRYADKEKTEERFDRILNELVADREAQSKKWEEGNKRWEENEKRWQANDRRWEENEKRWQANDRHWKENEKRWQANDRHWKENEKRWVEQERKWEENQKIIREIQESIKTLNRKYDSSIGALGARWGLRTEQSFRNALKGILREVSGLDVINVIEYDEEGAIFGHPEQIELDLVVKNGCFMICEIKSSISKSDMYIFRKKADFYQKRHNRQAQRLIAISPMVDKKAMEFAKDSGILVYSYVEDIEPNIFSD
ncbi:MAG: DUF3782 domain-containing protein [Planctomycetes bacterium]|nr:DUF3782 domain-containing protein [Planctomycetota bacterium]